MKNRLFILFVGILLSTSFVLSQDQTIDGNLMVTKKLTSKGIYLNNTDTEPSGWPRSLLQYPGGALVVGNTEGVPRDCNINFTPGGIDGKTLKTWFNMYIATGQGIYEKKVLINTQGSSFFNGGNVGIGIENPICKLDVNGTIRSKEVKIEATGWADFVFDKNYKLPTLSEVENHINKKGTLPDIPSEKEVIKNGISVGEMQAKLLQKIEELTLYVIDLKKENEMQNELIKELQNEKINH